MATKTEKIEVPITYEEVYVNNKKLRVYDKEEGILSKKDTIAHTASASDDDSIEYHYRPSTPSQRSHGNSKHDQNSSYKIRGEVVALN